MSTISDLPRLVEELPAAAQERFRRIFRVSVYETTLRLPSGMIAWVPERFGSVEAVQTQHIVRVTNLVTLEGALYNPLRAQRPIEFRDQRNMEARLLVGSRDEHFANPLAQTPEDPFGRIHGQFGVSAANVAKYDAHHGLVIFREHNPLRFSRASLFDYLDIAQRWLKAANELDSQALYPIIIWNCLWRAGASVTHGHLQVALTREMHYPKVERLRRAAQAYGQQEGSDYFQDWFQAHADVGCAQRIDGVGVVAHLAPTKEQEVILAAPSLNDSLKETLYRTLEGYIHDLQVTSFNMAIVMPPLTPASESWEGFPVLVHVVDRGDADNRTSDIGAMELYAETVVASDPFAVMEGLRTALGGPR